MIVRLYNAEGSVAHVSATQVVVCMDDGTPVSLAYQEGQRVICASAQEASWPQTVERLGLRAKPSITVKST